MSRSRFSLDKLLEPRPAGPDTWVSNCPFFSSLSLTLSNTCKAVSFPAIGVHRSFGEIDLSYLEYKQCMFVILWPDWPEVSGSEIIPVYKVHSEALPFVGVAGWPWASPVRMLLHTPHSLKRGDGHECSILAWETSLLLHRAGPSDNAEMLPESTRDADCRTRRSVGRFCATVDPRSVVVVVAVVTAVVVAVVTAVVVAVVVALVTAVVVAVAVVVVVVVAVVVAVVVRGFPPSDRWWLSSRSRVSNCTSRGGDCPNRPYTAQYQETN